MARTAPRRLAALLAATALLPLAGATSAAAPTSARIALQLLATGLTKPDFVTSAPDHSGRLFIVEQTGQIRILKNGQLLATPFLTIGGLAPGAERGLLGLAFSPGYASNRRLYINVTNEVGDTLIREYHASTTNPDIVDPTTARNVLKIAQPYANHNGGMLAFGPDGYLYIGMGDGGSGGDPGNRAQSTNTLLGKMLRINVNGRTSTRGYLIPSTNPYVGRTGRDEIWQIGLRNPWRFSFDRATGNLWIGDVGQNAWEEIDRAVRTSSGAGRGVNWGWRIMEGNHCYNPPTGCNTIGKTRPVTVYGHTAGRCAVTGGYVSRGPRVPALNGAYLFADYCTGEIFAINAAAPAPAPITRLLATGFPISSFGEDAAGNLYVLDYGGGNLYAIVPG